jgi:hypothetical protein
MSADPIRLTIERWHQHLAGNLPGGLDALLHPDCVFFSPIVFTPQRGRDVTKLYLGAAGATLVGGGNSGDDIQVDGASPFRYVKEIAEGRHAMLEFETTMHDGTRGVTVNGVDILTCDDDALIVEFKVMVRPLQAVNLVHAQMKAQLEASGAGG